MYVCMFLRLGIPFVQVHVPFEIQFLIEGSVRVFLPTIWTFEKQSGEVKSEETSDRRAKIRKTKIEPREVGGKPRIPLFNDFRVGKG